MDPTATEAWLPPLDDADAATEPSAQLREQFVDGIRLSQIAHPPLVAPLIAPVGVSIISGPPGVGKSLLALDAALSWAIKVDPWHGVPQPAGPAPASDWEQKRAEYYGQPDPGRIVWIIDEENPSGVYWRRVLAWMHTHRPWAEEAKDESAARLHAWGDWYDSRVRVAEPRGQWRLGDAGADLLAPHREFFTSIQSQRPGPPGLIVIDNLSVLNAAIDHNDAAAIGRVFSELHAISEWLHAPILLVTHMSKEGATAAIAALRIGLKPELRWAVAGSAMAANRATLVHVLAKDPQAPTVWLTQVKNRLEEERPEIWKMQVETVAFGWGESGGIVGEWETVTRHNDKKSQWIEWAIRWLDHQPTLTIADCTEENRSPAKKDTAKRYLQDDAVINTLAQAGVGIRERQTGRGGRPAKELYKEEE